MNSVSCLLSILCVLFLVSACAGPNRVEESYGTSVKVACFIRC